MSELSAFLAERYAGADPRNGAIIAHLEELWQLFKPFADPHFVREISNGNESTFQQRYWEMLLGAHLLRGGLQLIPTGGAGPDFRIQLNDGRTLWIEAVSPTPGEGQNRIPDLPLIDPNSDEPPAGVQLPDTEILLRYTAAVENKRRKREQDMEAQIVRPTDPFIIAVNAGQLGLFSWTGISQNPAIVEAVYPVGPQQYQFNVGNPTESRIDLQYRPAVATVNGVQIPTDGFLSARAAGISAVLATSRSEFHIFDQPSTPYIVVHNFSAAQPLRPCPISVDTEYRVEPVEGGYRISSTTAPSRGQPI